MNLHRILLFGMITTTQHHCQRYPQVGYTFHFKLIATDDAVLRAVKYTFHFKMITTLHSLDERFGHVGYTFHFKMITTAMVKTLLLSSVGYTFHFKMTTT